jgi:hypothetical protein
MVPQHEQRIQSLAESEDLLGVPDGSLMASTTAPDFQGPVYDLPRLDVAPGTTLELMVVAVGAGHCAGVDLASGVLVRAWSARRPERLPRPYDIVSVVLDDNLDVVPDPAAPEAVPLFDAPEITGRIAGRRAERLIRPLLHPKREPLLGFHAPAIRFWERTPDRPSIALVEPEGPIVLRRDRRYLACRFAWQGLVRELPCLDRRVAARMDQAGRTQAQGNKGDRLVVALTPPIDGHCHKVVEAVLPRP